MMNRIGITKKLFIITIVVFAVFISSMLLIQSLFFDKYYANQKRNDLKATMEKFRTNYNKAQGSVDQAAVIQEYEEAHNIRIAILDSKGQIKIAARSIRDRIDPGKSRDLNQFIFEWVKDQGGASNALNLKSTVTVAVEKRDLPERSIASITPNDESNEVIFAISSLQPVNEAVTAMKGFYIYFYIGAFFFIIFLSLVYSNMIAKPLVKINKTATKMSHLDFSEKCVVESGDEFGNVASSLNFLSENLDNALTSLTEANTQLEADIEKERSLEKMRKDFVAAVSHELKTPISLIDGYAVGLKDEIFEGEEEDYYLDVIIDEARKMGSLVTDMLDLSQLESGNFKLSKEDFDLKELMSHTIKKYIPIINERKLKLEVDLLEDVIINADWYRMEQVITNFITNALRHVNEEGTIFVRTVKVENGINVEIENTGSHIPEEELEKLWDKFYKIDKSRNRKEGGTGIGLSIVKNILLLHNYPYGAANTENGVKFYFQVTGT